jgi:L-ribulose-5-phosphate 3-epimerase
MKHYSLGLYEKSMPHSLTLHEKLIITKASGFDFLEISIDETEEKLSRLYWDYSKREEIITEIADTGISIGSMCLSGHRKYPLGSTDENTRCKSMDIMSRAIDFASDFGVRIIQLAGYDVYYEESTKRTREYFRENLTRSVKIAAKQGVVLAFETMETPFMDTVEKAMRYINEINSPFLQIYPDLGNLTNAALLYGSGVADDLKAGSGHIAALHLKETAPYKYRDVQYSSGHVDFAAGIDTAWQLDVRRYVGEFWDNGAYREQIDRAFEFLSGFLSKR